MSADRDPMVHNPFWLTDAQRPLGTYQPDYGAQNPARSVPPPVVPGVIRVWNQPQTPIRFSAPSGPPLNNPAFATPGRAPTTRAIWQSPLFDLRPDLRTAYSISADNPTAGAVALAPDGINGNGAILAVMIRRFPAQPGGNEDMISLPNDLDVYSVEQVALHDPTAFAANAQPGVAQRVNIGAELRGSPTPFSLLGWRPTYGTRYWRVAIVFDWHGQAGSEPVLSAEATAS